MTGLFRQQHPSQGQRCWHSCHCPDTVAVGDVDVRCGLMKDPAWILCLAGRLCRQSRRPHHGLFRQRNNGEDESGGAHA